MSRSTAHLAPTRRTPALAAVACLLGTLALGACGSDEGNGVPSSTTPVSVSTTAAAGANDAGNQGVVSPGNDGSGTQEGDNSGAGPNSNNGGDSDGAGDNTGTGSESGDDTGSGG